MNLVVLDKQFGAVGIIDVFESLVWTDRYNEAGQFELYTSMDPNIFLTIASGYFIKMEKSEHIMVIEAIEIRTDVETGNKLVVTGRSLESILDRRVVLGQTIIDGSLQDAIGQLLTENAIDSSQPNRNFPNMVFTASMDPIITALALKAQYDIPDYLYTVITGLCMFNKIGYKITLSETDQMVFQLYNGANRSYDQATNPYVVFSPEFDNLLSSNSFTTDRFKKTITFVRGDTSSGPPHVIPFGSEVPTGLDKRELYTDATDLSKFVEGTTTELPVLEYLEQLKERGRQDLREWKRIDTFDGQAQTTTGFSYGIDYFLGDIVQFANEYGIGGKARITEVVYSVDSRGEYFYPTFEMTE